MQSENNTPPALPFPLTFSPFLLLSNDLGEGGFELSRYLFLGSLLLSREGGGMDFSKVGEKFLSSVRSARSLGLIPSTSDRPEVPARAAAAAAVARVLAGLPPHQRQNLSSSSEELSSIYGTTPQNHAVDDLEEEFYEEEFDPVRHILEQIPSEENEAAYFEEKAALRLLQLDRISERLSRHVMEHHEEMVKGMNLVRELERDLKIANVICMNGRRHLTSSRNEVSRDLIVTANSRKKQALLDMLPILNELRHAVDLQFALETFVDEGNFSGVFQVLPEYVQLLDSLSKLTAVQEMSHGAEALLGKTLQKLDSLLLQVCQDFKEDSYLTVVDAYALIGDVSGLAEKIQSFFMQEVLSQSHSALWKILQEDVENSITQTTRFTYSDLCTRVPESKFRQCLLETLAVLYKLMCSYYAITRFQLEDQMAPYHNSSGKHVSLSEVPDDPARDVSSPGEDGSLPLPTEGEPLLSGVQTSPETPSASLADNTDVHSSKPLTPPTEERRDNGSEASSSGSLWSLLRKDALTLISHALQRGRKNLWQLTTSRVAVLLSSSAVSSTSIHQFLRNYEDLSMFILAGEAFCGVEATEFRLKIKSICGSYFAAFHRQNIYALKMVMEKESWQIMPPDTIHAVSFAGLVGDGAALIVTSDRSSTVGSLNNSRLLDTARSASKRSEFSYFKENGNPFLAKLNGNSEEHPNSFQPNGLANHGEAEGKLLHSNVSSASSNANHVNGSMSEDENEDLHADFIDEDSQLPSRSSKSSHSRHYSSGNEDIVQTASSLSLLRFMDKYARLMQKLEIVNVEFFKGICQLFEIFFYFVYETFCQHSNNRPSGKGMNDSLHQKLKTALSRITQECDQWIKPQPSSTSSSSPTSLNASFTHMDVTPTTPPNHLNNISFGLKQRCAGAATMMLVAQLLHKSKAHLQSMLLQTNGALVEDFYAHLVDAVPELIQHIHRTTAKLLLHMEGYVDRIANAKWEVKELGMEHNGYVDLLLGEFKHFKTRLAHGGIRKEVQDLLLEYGLETIAETLIEGLSRVKRCTDEGRALMSLDLQVLINGLKHFVPVDVRPKLQIVDTFIKAYYLPETEFVHWSRGHPEYSKSQIVGLINLVATMKGWKRKTRLEILDKIE